MYIDKDYALTKLSAEDLKRLTRDSDANLEQAITDASELANGYLASVSKVIPIPAEKVTNAIKQNVWYFTRFILWEGKASDDIPEHIGKARDIAEKWFKDVAAGNVSLNISLSEDDRQDRSTSFGADEPPYFDRSSY